MSPVEKLMFCVVIVLFVAVLIILYLTFKTITVEFFTTKTIKDSKHFQRYVTNISSQLYPIKVGLKNVSKKQFINKYISLLKIIPNNKINQLKLYTRKMNAKFINVNLENLSSTQTNYIMSVGTLEMKMPYTLDNTIVFNKQFLDKLNNYVDNPTLETFIHEKLHTIQRQHQDKFNEFYKSRYPFLYKSISLENLPEKLKHVHMTNPDNNFDLWLFKINNKLYIPILEITKNGLKEYAYEHKNIKNKILLKNILTYYNKSQTHPNEIFAYEVANQIMSEKLDDTIQKFLVNL